MNRGFRLSRTEENVASATVCVESPVRHQEHGPGIAESAPLGVASHLRVAEIGHEECGLAPWSSLALLSRYRPLGSPCARRPRADLPIRSPARLASGTYPSGGPGPPWAHVRLGAGRAASPLPSRYPRPGSVRQVASIQIGASYAGSRDPTKWSATRATPVHQFHMQQLTSKSSTGSRSAAPSIRPTATSSPASSSCGTRSNSSTTCCNTWSGQSRRSASAARWSWSRWQCPRAATCSILTVVARSKLGLPR